MTIAEPEVGALVITLARAGGVVATAPVIGESGVSLRARLVFVLAVSLALAGLRHPVPLGDVPGLAALELATGILVGTTARFIVARAAIAGQLMGLSLGLGFAQQYDPHAGESALVVRTLASTLASLAFLSVGGLESIVRSIAAGPAEAPHVFELGMMLIRQATLAMQSGLALAAPVVLAAFAGNIGMAVMNRAAPAVHVFSIALTAVILVGGFTLLASSTSFIAGIQGIAHEAANALAR